MIKYLLFLLGSIFAASGVQFFKALKLPIHQVPSLNTVFELIFSWSFFLGILFYGLAFLVMLLLISNYPATKAIAGLTATYLLLNGVIGIVTGDLHSLRDYLAYGLILAGVYFL